MAMDSRHRHQSDSNGCRLLASFLVFHSYRDNLLSCQLVFVNWHSAVGKQYSYGVVKFTTATPHVAVHNVPLLIASIATHTKISAGNDPLNCGSALLRCTTCATYPGAIPLQI